MLFACAVVRAEMVATEIGAGIRQSNDSNLLRVRYAEDWAPVDRLMSFVDLSASTWGGDNANNAIAGGLGLRYDLPRENYISASMGLAYVSDETENLGTHGQLQFRFALGHRFERYDFSIGYTHYSNGKGVFNWDGPNRGEDFITLQLGYHFGTKRSEVSPLPVPNR